jgi:hypothetical protein
MTAGNSPSQRLVKADASDVPATLGHELEEAAGYARAEKAPATRRAYRSDFELFRSWCMTKREDRFRLSRRRGQPRRKAVHDRAPASRDPPRSQAHRP